MTKSLDLLIDKLGCYCKEHRLTIVTAESCTGGGIAFKLSQSKSCSAILERGYVTYSNQSKENLLGVKPESLQLEGSVSKKVAIEMAEGALKNSIAQVAISITGIAGEDTEVKGNEGVAWLGLAVIDKVTLTRKINYKGNREAFIDYAISQGVHFMSEVLVK